MIIPLIARFRGPACLISALASTLACVSLTNIEHAIRFVLCSNVPTPAIATHVEHQHASISKMNPGTHVPAGTALGMQTQEKCIRPPIRTSGKSVLSILLAGSPQGSMHFPLTGSIIKAIASHSCCSAWAARLYWCVKKYAVLHGMYILAYFHYSVCALSAQLPTQTLHTSLIT